MPDWARIQVLVGAALCGGVFAHGVWRGRPVLHLVAELGSGACCAALFLAYWDIRVNAALGGWVIPLFLFVVLREDGYAIGALRTEASTEVSPDNPLPQWVRYYLEAFRGLLWVVPAIYLGGLLTYRIWYPPPLRTEGSTEGSPDNPLPQWVRYYLEAFRGLLWVVPAIYLGGLLTYRIWYPPPLDDSLTHGVENPEGMRAALRPVIPIGSPLAAARDSLERYGFDCLPDRDAFSNHQKLTDCHKHVPAPDSTTRQWMIILEHRHDSVLGFRIDAYVVKRQ